MLDKCIASQLTGPTWRPCMRRRADRMIGGSDRLPALPCPHRRRGSGTPGISQQRETRASARKSATMEGMSATKSALVAGRGMKLVPPKITKSDAAFAKEHIEFVFGSDLVDIEELNDLFEKVGFPRRDPARMKLALTHTHEVLWVRCTRSSRWARMGQMLAFSRATSDTALSATIWDVAVNPSWQRAGIGRAMVERLIGRLLEEDIGTITLYAEPTVTGLYEKLSFVQDPQGIKGMAFQRSSRAGKALIAAAAAAAAVSPTATK